MHEVSAPASIQEPPQRLYTELEDWFIPVGTRALEAHLTTLLTEEQPEPCEWDTARLSAAVYLYRERVSGQVLVAKFHSVKTGENAGHYTEREFQETCRSASLNLGDELRAITPLSAWRGVLMTEFVDGLTLEDVIAIRRSRPGTLLPSVRTAATYLAAQHAVTLEPRTAAVFNHPPKEARKIVRTLVEHGVLHDQPEPAAALMDLLETWEEDAYMRSFVPCWTHGDATTTNFLFPTSGGVVGIDFERAQIADPAADLGRLMAETTHSILAHGGSEAEAEGVCAHAVRGYLDRALPVGESFERRLRYYRASSTLRIARNGWIALSDRSRLVELAMQALSASI